MKLLRYFSRKVGVEHFKNNRKKLVKGVSDEKTNNVTTSDELMTEQMLNIQMLFIDSRHREV